MAKRSVGDVTQAGALELVVSACLFTTALATSVAAVPQGGRSWVVTAAPVFIALLFCGLIVVKRYLIDTRVISLETVRPTRTLPLVVGALFLPLAFINLVPERVTGILGTPLLVALIMSALVLLAGQGRPRFYIHVATALLTAALVSLAGVDDTLGTVWVALATGCALLLVGGWVLAGFVRQVRS